MSHLTDGRRRRGGHEREDKERREKKERRERKIKKTRWKRGWSTERAVDEAQNQQRAGYRLAVELDDASLLE